MKTIRLSRLQLTNFKNIRQGDYRFSSSTYVLGGNGTGKTTIFDAFTWLLFGTDHQGRTDFAIKTLDSEGNPIPELPHEVTATVTVDGEEMTLTRRLTEKWVKSRGSNTRSFQGHKVEYLVNNVPCKEKEYSLKVELMCPAVLFRILSNPFYFCTQLNPDKRRSLLTDIFGAVTDEQVYAADPSFASLAPILAKKTETEYLRELSARKKTVKDEQSDIPGRIDELKRSIITADFATLNKQYEELSHEHEALTDKLQSSPSEQTAKAVSDYDSRLQQLLIEKQQRATEVRAKATEEYQQRIEEQRKLKTDIDTLKRENLANAQQAESLRREVSECDSKLDALRRDWHDICTLTLTFTADEFVCPCCHRPLPASEAEARKAQLAADFNADKARRKSDNQSQGRRTAERRKEAADLIAQLEQKTADNISAIEEMRTRPLYSETITDNSDEAVLRDTHYNDICRSITDLQAARPKPAADEEARKAARQADLDRLHEIERQQEDLRKQLAQQSVNETMQQRISELTERLATCGQTLTDIELQEDLLKSFRNTRMSMFSDNINAQFRGVRFRFFAPQVNGDYAPDCTATVSGVPYPSANTASQVNAGLSIIRAISSKIQVSVPVFCDNAESVNTFTDMPSQMVYLKVTDAPELAVSQM